MGAEILVAIDEMVDQRVEAGEPEESAMKHVLTGPGDPASLAGSFVVLVMFFVFRLAGW